MKMENKLGKIVEAFDQKVGTGLFSSADCFFFHVVNEILERGLYDDAIKPGSIVVDETDIVDDDVVEFPFFIDEVSL